MNMLITFIIGVGYDKSGESIWPENLEQTMNQARNHLAKRFGGYTEHAFGTGGWIGPNGALITEPYLAYSVYTDKEDAHRLALESGRDMARWFDQQSVVVNVMPAGTLAFVSADTPIAHEDYTEATRG